MSSRFTMLADGTRCRSQGKSPTGQEDQSEIGAGHLKAHTQGEAVVFRMPIFPSPSHLDQGQEQNDDQDGRTPDPQEICRQWDAHKPEPNRDGTGNPAAVQRVNGNQIEKVEHEADLSQQEEKLRAFDPTAQVNQEGGQDSGQRAAVGHLGFPVDILRSSPQVDDRTQKGQKYRQADRDAQMPGGQVMAHLVNEEEQDKSDGEGPTENPAVDEQGKDHGPKRGQFQDDQNKF